MTMNDDLAKLHRIAESQGLICPVSPLEAAKCEETLGFPLPSFLRDVYLTIGSGFGPGYGLLPLLESGRKDASESMVQLYEAFYQADPDDAAWSWPISLLPINDWGCAIRSCARCDSDTGPVIRFDPNGHGPGFSWETAFTPEHDSVRAWFMDWAEQLNQT
jgi:hypothetical protein